MAQAHQKKRPLPAVRGVLQVHNDDGTTRRILRNADIEWQVAQAVQCAAAKNGSKHFVRLSLAPGGQLVSVECSCDDADKTHVETIIGLGGKSCVAVKREVIKKYLKALKDGSSTYIEHNNAPFDVALKRAVIAGRGRSEKLRPHHEPTRKRRVEAMYVRRVEQLTAAGEENGLAVTCNYVEHTGEVRIDFDGQPLAYRKGFNVPWTRYGGGPSRWLDGEYCRCCQETFHPGYLKRHESTAGHSKAATAMVAKVVNGLNALTGNLGVL